MTEDRQAANVVVILVRDRNELRRTIRSFYGRERANQIERRLAPRCLSGFGEDARHRIRRSEVILTADGGDLEFFDCAYEELLQALGRQPPSMPRFTTSSISMSSVTSHRSPALPAPPQQVASKADAA